MFANSAYRKSQIFQSEYSGHLMRSAIAIAEEEIAVAAAFA